jgi:hypothetical protein
MNIEEVTTALAGVFTGETESLKRLGVVMTQVNLENFAMQQGIKKTMKQMTQAEKVQLRYQFVMAKTANAHGDFARTSDGAANQMRIFQESTKELGASFGSVILPAFTKLVKFGNNVLKMLKNLDPVTKKVVTTFAALAAVAGPLMYLAGTVIPAIVAAFASLTLASGGVVLAIGALAAALGATIKYQSLKNTVKDLNEGLKKLQANLHSVKGEFNGSTESSLELAKAQKKVIEQKLKLAKANRDLKQGAIASMFGIESDEVKALDAEIKKHENTIAGYDMQIKGLEKSLTKASEATAKAKEKTDELGRSLKKVEAHSQINLSIKKGDFDFKKGEFAKGDVAVGAEGFDIKPPKGEDITKSLQSSFESLSKKSKEVSEEISVNFGQIGSTLAASLGEALVSGENVVGLIGATIFKTLGEILIQMGTAAIAASNLMTTFAIPGVGVVAGLAAIALGAGISALASKIQSEGVPAFANGGIVSGPTLGLMGEYSGARSNPEVIAPLDKLKGMIGQSSQNVNVGGEFRIQGQDLVVALQRAERNRSRIL